MLAAIDGEQAPAWHSGDIEFIAADRRPGEIGEGCAGGELVSSYHFDSSLRWTTSQPSFLARGAERDRGGRAQAWPYPGAGRDAGFVRRRNANAQHTAERQTRMSSHFTFRGIWFPPPRRRRCCGGRIAAISSMTGGESGAAQPRVVGCNLEDGVFLTSRQQKRTIRSATQRSIASWTKVRMAV